MAFDTARKNYEGASSWKYCKYKGYWEKDSYWLPLNLLKVLQN